MKPSAESEERPSSASTASSAAGFGGSAGTSRVSSGFGRRRRRRTTRRTSAGTIALRARLTPESPPQQQAEHEQRGDRDEPGHEPLRHRADEAEPPAARARRLLRELDVADDRVELPVADRAPGERRHDV